MKPGLPRPQKTVTWVQQNPCFSKELQEGPHFPGGKMALSSPFLGLAQPESEGTCGEGARCPSQGDSRRPGRWGGGSHGVGGCRQWGMNRVCVGREVESGGVFSQGRPRWKREGVRGHQGEDGGQLGRPGLGPCALELAGRGLSWAGSVSGGRA